MKRSKQRLCIAGNLLGQNCGQVTTQGQILADRLVVDGFDVITVSSRLNPVVRLLDVIWTILRAHRNLDILIVEIYSGRAFILADAASFLAKLCGIPSILVLHGGNLPDFAERFPSWVKRVLGRAEVLVSPSAFLAKGLAKYGIESRVIPNVIDIHDYSYRLRDKISPKLFWMRSFHSIYNPHMAVKVLSSIRKKYPGASLVMAGVDKGLEQGTKALVEEMGLSEAVRFPGFLDHQSKIEEFSNADIFMNTNRIDNMPVALLEACAMGLPVVATRVGGVPDMIENGRNGLMVPDGDVEEMASAVDALLTQSQLAERISLNGRKLAERSSWENVRTQWEKLFNEIQLNNKKSKLLGVPVGKVTNL